MEKKNKLITNMWIFSTIIIVVFALIIINEKKYTLLEDKIEEKLTTYINSNYQEIKQEIKIHNIKYQPGSHLYKMKISNQQNKNLFFYVSYHNKKISSTYQKDYMEGKSLLTFYQEKFEKDINEGKKLKTSFTFTKKLNSYTSDIQEAFIHNQIKELPIYELKTELKPTSFTVADISSSIKDYHQYILSLGYHPKSYTFKVLFDDINQSFELKKVTPELINTNTKEIINGIISKNQDIMSLYNITYQYLY